jgi:hypothetical protein
VDAEYGCEGDAANLQRNGNGTGGQKRERSTCLTDKDTHAAPNLDPRCAHHDGHAREDDDGYADDDFECEQEESEHACAAGIEGATAGQETSASEEAYDDDADFEQEDSDHVLREAQQEDHVSSSRQDARAGDECAHRQAEGVPRDGEYGDEEFDQFDHA